MLRGSIFWLLFVCCVSTGFTQVQLEIFTGLTSGKFSEKASTDISVSDAFKRLNRFPSIGLLSDFGLSESSRLETGLIFSSRGSKIGGDQILLDYIDVPFNFVIQPKNFRAFFGPQLSILSTARTGDFYVTDAFEKKDWCLRYGVGFEKGIAVRLIFQNGLKDIFTDPSFKWRSNSITLSLGFLIKKFDRSKYIPEDPLKGFKNGT